MEGFHKMNKKKLLHRKTRKSSKTHYADSKYHRRLHKGKNVDLLGDDLPKHVRIRPHKYRGGLNVTPLYEFLQTKVGENWDDVYSEILTKIDPKYRYMIDSYISNNNGWWSMIESPIYDDIMIPRNDRGRILIDTLFVDYNNILVKKTEEDILSDSLRYIRLEKLRRISQSDSD